MSFNGLKTSTLLLVVSTVNSPAEGLLFIWLMAVTSTAAVSVCLWLRNSNKELGSHCWVFWEEDSLLRRVLRVLLKWLYHSAGPGMNGSPCCSVSWPAFVCIRGQFWGFSHSNKLCHCLNLRLLSDMGCWAYFHMLLAACMSSVRCPLFVLFLVRSFMFILSLKCSLYMLVLFLFLL